MPASRALVLLVLMLASACRPDTVDLSYGYEAGREFNYRLVAVAESDWEIGGRGEGSYEITFRVSETIESVDEDGAITEIELRPIDVIERGLPSPGARARTFRLRVGPAGEVLEVIEVDGMPASSLEPDQLAFIGTYRPPLPLESVTLASEWRSRQEVQLGPVFQQITTLGVLESLDRDGSGAFAELDYVGEGPLSFTTTLPQGTAELTGSAITRTKSIFDLDGDYLRGSSSSTEGNFEVRVVPVTGGAPISGSLRLELNLDLEAVPGG